MFKQHKSHHVMPKPPAPKPDPGDVVLVNIQEKIKVSDRQQLIRLHTFHSYLGGLGVAPAITTTPEAASAAPFGQKYSVQVANTPARQLVGTCNQTS